MIRTGRCAATNGPAAPQARWAVDATGWLATRTEARFDLDYHYKHVDTIFDRVFGAS